MIHETELVGAYTVDKVVDVRWLSLPLATVQKVEFNEALGPSLNLPFIVYIYINVYGD